MNKILMYGWLPLAVAGVMAGNSWAENAVDAGRAIPSFNPDISAIVDLYYHRDDGAEGIAHMLEELSGFGHAHEEEAEEHAHHHGPDEGFNLRHLELQFTAAVDPYFKAAAIAAIDLDAAEMEVAEIETTCLPWGFKLKGGKFYSDFSYINAQHAHQWDFTDQPLIYQLTLGEHGLNDKGAQVSWLAPVPFYLLAGVEAFQGDNEKAFAYHGDGPFPEHAGPCLGVGWLKLGPALPGAHGLQVGVAAGSGKHQEEHDGDGDGASDHWLDGDHTFWSVECVYKFNAPKSHGQGDLTVQAEYFNREKDLSLVAHDLRPELVGNPRVDKQDGYYLQAVYGFLPRWRAGVRWEQVGLTNETQLPSGDRESFDTSDRASVMLDFTPSEFSRIRLQANQGAYTTEEGAEDVAEIYLQWMVSLGAHGAHKF